MPECISGFFVRTTPLKEKLGLGNKCILGFMRRIVGLTDERLRPLSKYW